MKTYTSHSYDNKPFINTEHLKQNFKSDKSDNGLEEEEK